MKRANQFTHLFLFLLLAAVVSCAPQVQQAPVAELEQEKEQQMAKQMLNRGQYAASDREFADPESEFTGSLGTQDQFSEISRDIAAKIYQRIQQKGDAHVTGKIAVTVGVPLSDFKRETEFGRLLAEYIVTDLAGMGMQVAELRIGKEIIILPQTGEFILSRNEGELLHPSAEFDYVVVSTFSNTRSTLIVQGRLVEAKSGIVATSWRFHLPLNREILGLFYNPHEIAPANKQPFTMAVKGLGE